VSTLSRSLYNALTLADGQTEFCSLEFQPPPYSTAPFALDHFLGLSPTQTHLTHASRSDGSRAPAEKIKGEGRRILTSMSLGESGCERGQNGLEDKTKSVPTNGDSEAIALGGRGVVKVSPETGFTRFSRSSAQVSTFMQVSPRKYLDWTLPRPPDLLFALADEPTEREPGKKRLEKSVRRSFVWLDEVARGAQVSKVPFNILTTINVEGWALSRRVERMSSRL